MNQKARQMGNTIRTVAELERIRNAYYVSPEVGRKIKQLLAKIPAGKIVRLK